MIGRIVKMDFKNMPQFDLSYATNIANDIQRQQEENLKAINEAAEEKNEEENLMKLGKQLWKQLKIQLK